MLDTRTRSELDMIFQIHETYEEHYQAYVQMLVRHAPAASGSAPPSGPCMPGDAFAQLAI